MLKRILCTAVKMIEGQPTEYVQQVRHSTHGYTRSLSPCLYTQKMINTPFLWHPSYQIATWQPDIKWEKTANVRWWMILYLSSTFYGKLCVVKTVKLVFKRTQKIENGVHEMHNCTGDPYANIRIPGKWVPPEKHLTAYSRQNLPKGIVFLAEISSAAIMKKFSA